MGAVPASPGEDAPGTGQGFRSRAKQAAPDPAFGTAVPIREVDQDRAGRMVADVPLIDLNRASPPAFRSRTQAEDRSPHRRSTGVERHRPMITAANIRQKIPDRTRAVAAGGIAAIHLTA